MAPTDATSISPPSPSPSPKRLPDPVLDLILRHIYLQFDYCALASCARVDRLQFHRLASKYLYALVVYSPGYSPRVLTEDDGTYELNRDYGVFKAATMKGGEVKEGEQEQEQGRFWRSTGYGEHARVLEISGHLPTQLPPPPPPPLTEGTPAPDKDAPNAFSDHILEAVRGLPNLTHLIVNPQTAHEDLFLDLFAWISGAEVPPASVKKPLIGPRVFGVNGEVVGVRDDIWEEGWGGGGGGGSGGDDDSGPEDGGGFIIGPGMSMDLGRWMSTNWFGALGQIVEEDEEDEEREQVEEKDEEKRQQQQQQRDSSSPSPPPFIIEILQHIPSPQEPEPSPPPPPHHADVGVPGPEGSPPSPPSTSASASPIKFAFPDKPAPQTQTQAQAQVDQVKSDPLTPGLLHLKGLVLGAQCQGERIVPLVTQIRGLEELTVLSPSGILLAEFANWLERLGGGSEGKGLRMLRFKNNCGSLTPALLNRFTPQLRAQGLTSFTLGLSYSFAHQDLWDFFAQIPQLAEVRVRYCFQFKPSYRPPTLAALRSLTVEYQPVLTRFEADSLCKWVRRTTARADLLECLRLVCLQDDGVVDIEDTAEGSWGADVLAPGSTFWPTREGGGGGERGWVKTECWPPLLTSPEALTLPTPTPAVAFDSLIWHLTTHAKWEKRSLKILDMRGAFVGNAMLRRLVGTPGGSSNDTDREPCWGMKDLEELWIATGREGLKTVLSKTGEVLPKLHTASFTICNVRNPTKMAKLREEVVREIMTLADGPRQLRRLGVGNGGRGQWWEGHFTGRPKNSNVKAESEVDQQEEAHVQTDYASHVEDANLAFVVNELEPRVLLWRVKKEG